jgi:hypothetical protein
MNANAAFIFTGKNIPLLSEKYIYFYRVVVGNTRSHHNLLKMTEQNKPRQEFSEIFSELHEIIASIKIVQYKFMDNNEYKTLSDLGESQYIYWCDIIQRTLFCSITSVQRVYKWMEAMNTSWNSNNYYGFCASLRGLIEACSDSFYTTSKICDPIAENFYSIEKALNLKAKIVMLSEAVENVLIHYMFARKLDSTEIRENPETHKALQVTQYLNHIGDDDVKSLYSELCQVSHPSMMSLAPFVYSDKEYEFILHNQDVDSVLNKNLLDRYRTKILLAIRAGIVPSMGLLKIIGRFDAEAINSLKVEDTLLRYINDSEFWKDLETKIKNSRTVEK